MNKILIPALLVATVMVAGMFAFAPVEQASTVHTTTASLENQIQYVTITDTCNVTDGDGDDCDNLEIDVATGAIFEIISATMTVTEVGGGATTDVAFADCTIGGSGTTETTGIVLTTGGTIGGGTSEVINDQTAGGAVGIGTADTNDIECVGTITVTDDDVITVSFVLQMDADAADPTFSIFDDAP